MAGLSYLSFGINSSWFTELIGTDPTRDRHPVVVVFCCLLCIRYYASIVFLTYDDTASPRVQALEVRARRAIFFIQLFLILGCNLNIAILPVFGGAAATVVIVAQASLLIGYWRWLWRVLLVEDENANFNVVKAMGDLAILVSALIFLIWELGWFEYNETGAGMCMGAILMIFLIECGTTYRQSLKSFVEATAEFLRENTRSQQQPAAGAGS